MYGEIFRLASAGLFAPRVAAVKKLSEVTSALQEVAEGRGAGKVLLRLGE
jgi:D-arabinose 1-dehydrogenase-like Zn-dependent alcohol dehydrogenase